MEAFWNAPPVIRTLTAAVVATSCAAYANRSILALVYFDYTRAFWMFPPQVWRVFTAFLVSGPNLYIIMDPYFCEFVFADELLEDGANGRAGSVHLWQDARDELAALPAQGRFCVVHSVCHECHHGMFFLVYLSVASRSPISRSCVFEIFNHKFSARPVLPS